MQKIWSENMKTHNQLPYREDGNEDEMYDLLPHLTVCQ